MNVLGPRQDLKGEENEKRKTSYFHFAFLDFAHLLFFASLNLLSLSGQKKQSRTGGYLKWKASSSLVSFWTWRCLCNHQLANFLSIILYGITSVKYVDCFVDIASVCSMEIIQCAASCLCVPVCEVHWILHQWVCYDSWGVNPKRPVRGD